MIRPLPISRNSFVNECGESHVTRPSSSVPRPIAPSFVATRLEAVGIARSPLGIRAHARRHVLPVSNPFGPATRPGGVSALEIGHRLAAFSRLVVRFRLAREVVEGL